MRSTYRTDEGAVLDLDKLVDELKSIYDDLLAIMKDPVQNRELILAKLQELDNAQQRLKSSEFTPEYIAEQNEEIENVKTAISCLINTGSNNARQIYCDPSDIETKINESIDNAENSTINPYSGDVFDENGEFISAESNINGKYVIIKTYSLSYVLLRDYALLPNNYDIINKIFLHYWAELGFSPALLKDGKFTVRPRQPNEDGDLATSCSTNEIFVYVENQNKVRRGHHYKAFLKSTLFHEKFHLVERLACPVDNSYNYYDEHIEVNYKQFTRFDFATTMDQSWIMGLWMTVADKFIVKLRNKEREDFWKNKFKSLNLGL